MSGLLLVCSADRRSLELTGSNDTRGSSCCCTTEAKEEESNFSSHRENHLYMSSRRELCFQTLGTPPSYEITDEHEAECEM
jgi:hypothetical protein